MNNLILNLTHGFSILSEKKDDREDRIADISQLYQIFPDEILGSGQFGIVYGGILNYCCPFQIQNAL